jgi:tetratricopeptide (TPR) repeat protein
VGREVTALLLLSSAQFWISRELCLQAVDQATELSRHIQDDLLRARVRGYCGHWNLNLRGWRDDEAQAFVAGLQAARQSGDRSRLSLHVVRDCYFQCMRSDYAAACRAAEEGMQLALETGDAFDYMLAKFFGAWAMLHRGQWGHIPPSLQHGIEMAERNGHDLWARLFRMGLAWLYEEAFNFEPARALCEPAVQYARASPQETGQLLFKSLIVSGLAHTGLEQYDRAKECFGDIMTRLENERWVMDWILNAPLHYGLSECQLRQGDFNQAGQTAERLCELASLAPERTYLALGRRVLAEVAMAEKDWRRAEAELAQALTVLEDAEAPLAQWRVYATAAQLHARRRRKSEAKSYWARSAAVLHRLADSLGDAGDVRQTFFNHPSVQAIIRSAEGG